MLYLNSRVVGEATDPQAPHVAALPYRALAGPLARDVMTKQRLLDRYRASGPFKLLAGVN